MRYAAASALVITDVDTPEEVVSCRKECINTLSDQIKDPTAHHYRTVA